MDFAVLATGPSLTIEQCEAVRGRFRVLAVSDAYRLAPWAEGLVSADAAWWQFHRPQFAGRKFAAGVMAGIEQIGGKTTGINSGALAVRLARFMGAHRVALFGFDGCGSHFFGEHPAPLKNTPPHRFAEHAKQHASEAADCLARHVRVVNCSPGTVLRAYPVGSLEDFGAENL